MKSLKMFIIGIIIGQILGFFDLSFWQEIGIVSIMAIIVMILFRDKL